MISPNSFRCGCDTAVRERKRGQFSNIFDCKVLPPARACQRAWPLTRSRASPTRSPGPEPPRARPGFPAAGMSDPGRSDGRGPGAGVVAQCSSPAPAATSQIPSPRVCPFQWPGPFHLKFRALAGHEQVTPRPSFTETVPVTLARPDSARRPGWQCHGHESEHACHASRTTPPSGGSAPALLRSPASPTPTGIAPISEPLQPLPRAPPIFPFRFPRRLPCCCCCRLRPPAR